jgi:hypothetical protein
MTIAASRQFRLRPLFLSLTRLLLICSGMNLEIQALLDAVDGGIVEAHGVIEQDGAVNG